MSPRLLIVCMSLLLLGLIGACSQQEEEPGVVAMINSMPIYLEELENSYDLQNMSGDNLQNPSVAKLKRDYGAILGDLMIQKLVHRALDTMGLGVSDKEVGDAEAQVRADYPQGMFEQVLTEECIDLGRWREQLRARLARDKFLQEVLRPTIRLDSAQAEDYYYEHLEDFHVPPQVGFLLLLGPGREMVAKALEQYQANRDLDQLLKNFDTLDVQDLKMRQDRLPVSWRQELDALEPGQAGEVTKGAVGYQALLLKERIPARTLPLVQAYAQVERVLLEEKLEQAFHSWLDQELASAVIYVNSRLLTPEAEGGESESAEEFESQDEVPMDGPLAENATLEDSTGESGGELEEGGDIPAPDSISQ